MSKKLQLGTPLRREIPVTDRDWLVDSVEGLAVENTQAIVFASDTANLDIVVEGRIDNNGWHLLSVNKEAENLGKVDVSQWERIRFRSRSLQSPYTLRLAGFDPIRFYDSIITESSDKDFAVNQKIMMHLENMSLELKKLNVHMSVITNEKVTSDDVLKD